MKRFCQSDPVASTELAKALLGAWLNGERKDLEAQVERSCNLMLHDDNTLEDERLEVLGAVAARLKSYTNVQDGEPMDAALVTCVDLLLHLAQGASPTLMPVPTRRPATLRRGLLRIEIALTTAN
jgi:hypothetical protein